MTDLNMGLKHVLLQKIQNERNFEYEINNSSKISQIYNNNNDNSNCYNINIVNSDNNNNNNIIINRKITDFSIEKILENNKNVDIKLSTAVYRKKDNLEKERNHLSINNNKNSCNSSDNKYSDILDLSKTSNKTTNYLIKNFITNNKLNKDNSEKLLHHEQQPQQQQQPKIQQTQFKSSDILIKPKVIKYWNTNELNSLNFFNPNNNHNNLENNFLNTINNNHNHNNSNNNGTSTSSYEFYYKTINTTANLINQNYYYHYYHQQYFQQQQQQQQHPLNSEQQQSILLKKSNNFKQDHKITTTPTPTAAATTSSLSTIIPSLWPSILKENNTEIENIKINQACKESLKNPLIEENLNVQKLNSISTINECDGTISDAKQLNFEKLYTKEQLKLQEFVQSKDINRLNCINYGNNLPPATLLLTTSGDDEFSFRCHICDKVFGCSITLQTHIKTHKSPRYECMDCGKGFSQLRNYKYHLSVHRGTKEFAAECPECGKVFNDKGYLSSHMKIHRNKKEYECPYCPKSFNQRVAFNMHVRIHTGVKPHKCNECGKRFSRKMLLKQHMRTHSGEKPYTCSVCGKSFADRSNMTLHHRLHSGIKPFTCPICPKAFTKKHHLKTHLNYHTGCKPYVCPHPNCNQAFTQSSNMRTHAKKCQFKPSLDYDLINCNNNNNNNRNYKNNNTNDTNHLLKFHHQDVKNNLQLSPEAILV